MNIEIYKGGISLPFDSWIFPGGEIGIKLKTTQYNFNDNPDLPVIVIARIVNCMDFIALAMVKDALVNMGQKNLHLVLPYCPYARQDRVCDKGEAFALGVFADLINGLKFASVTIYDPHSSVINSRLFNNLKIVTQFDIIHQFEAFTKRVFRGVVFVSPDAGAAKKTAELAKYYNHVEFIRADKNRDLSTGKIIETVIYADDLKGLDAVIADDICDGGATFIQLAKALKSKNCGKIILYVTHGIFSKGTDVLREGGVDEIFTTNTFNANAKYLLDPQITWHDMSLKYKLSYNTI